MKILITGGAGFIGSQLVERLITQGHDITIIDDFSRGREENLEVAKKLGDFHLIKDRIHNLSAYYDTLEGTEVVFHLAAFASMKEDLPDKMFWEDVVGTHHVLEMCRIVGVKEIVFSSSCTVYGYPDQNPAPETTLHKPISVYGAAKSMSEKQMMAYRYMYGIEHYIFRFGNVIGPRSVGTIIPDFVDKLKANPDVMEVLGDGQQYKDYIHVSELLDAILHVYEKRSPGIYNLGLGDKVIVDDIAHIVADVMGVNPRLEHKINPNFQGGWKGDITEIYLDTSKINAMGWIPKYNCRESIKKAAEEVFQEKYGSQ